MNKPIVSLGSAPSDNNFTVVRADHVSVFYGDFLAVRDVSLKIAKNKIVAFIHYRHSQYAAGRSHF